MIYLFIFSLLWFRRSQILPPNCAKDSLRVYGGRLMGSMNMDSLEGDYGSLYMESCNLWKFSDLFFWRHNVRAAVFFAIYFFFSSFYLLFQSTSVHWYTLAMVRYIPELESGLLLVVTSFSNITFFCWSIIIQYLFIY